MFVRVVTTQMYLISLRDWIEALKPDIFKPLLLIFIELFREPLRPTTKELLLKLGAKPSLGPFTPREYITVFLNNTPAM